MKIMRKYISIVITITILMSTLTGCVSIFQKTYTMEEMQQKYPPESEQMFWIERYGIPDEIKTRYKEDVDIKYEVFFWRKGKEDEIWIQFENDKATIFSYL